LKDASVTSCIGYVSRNVLVQDGITSYIIVLQEFIQEFDNIIITPKDAREIVMSAIHNIPGNYPSKPSSLVAFIESIHHRIHWGLSLFT